MAQKQSVAGHRRRLEDALMSVLFKIKILLDHRKRQDSFDAKLILVIKSFLNYCKGFSCILLIGSCHL